MKLIAVGLWLLALLTLGGMYWMAAAEVVLWQASKGIKPTGEDAKIMHHPGPIYGAAKRVVRVSFWSFGMVVIGLGSLAGWLWTAD